jgi:hypothetical protein
VTQSTGGVIAAKCRGNDVADVMLGKVPTAACGAKAHRHTYRFAAHVEEVVPPGPIEQIAVFRDGPELWRYRDHETSRLAIFDGKVTQLPAVGDKPCAVIDLASNGDVIAGLVTGCSPDAPIRVVQYRWPGPSTAVTQLDPPAKLGVQPEQLTIDRTGTIALTGIANGRLATRRLDGSLQLGSVPAAKIASLIGAPDGAVWAITTDAGGKPTDAVLTRDHVVVALPAGLHAEALGLDANVGVVVHAVGNGKHWIFAERVP